MHKLSAHLIPNHWDRSDEEQLERIRPRSAKIIEHFSPAGPPTRTLQVHKATPQTLLVLRDHPLSEQAADIWKDPEGTGRRHADEWATKFKAWNKHESWRMIPPEQIVVLGQNEFGIWDDQGGPNEGKPSAKGVGVENRYHVAWLKRCKEHGLRPGAFNRNVGWPANWGTDLPPDWSPWAECKDLILEADGFAFLHMYWPKGGVMDRWKWLAGRHTQFDWDVPIIIGECGYNARVGDSSIPVEREGWKAWITKEEYAKQLLQYNAEIMKDRRIHSAQVFTWDYSNPFGSTDVRPVAPLWPANDAWDNMLNWKTGTVPPPVTPPPVVTPPPTDPIADVLLPLGEKHQKIRFNRDAALQKAAFAADFVPNSDEFNVVQNGVNYVAQRTEHLGTGKVRIYYARVGDWGNVRFVERT